MLLRQGLVALDNRRQVGVHHLRNHVTICYLNKYMSSNSSRDLGKIIVSMLMMFSCLSSFSSRSSRNVLLAKILCSNALSIFFIATSYFPSVLHSLSLAATTIPYAPCPTTFIKNSYSHRWSRTDRVSRTFASRSWLSSSSRGGSCTACTWWWYLGRVGSLFSLYFVLNINYYLFLYH